MLERRYLFTVFTPTYNRAHTLSRVYESLAQQSLRDFEWLVVDDGSTDDTAELIYSWQATAEFPIRYVWQPNQGKHVAHDRAVSIAQGALFLTLDSDDACTPNALERLAIHWHAIPDSQRDAFSAVTVLCMDQRGRVIGDPFPGEVLDANLAEVVYRHRVRGEKWGFQRTDVLRQFPFAANPNSGLVPEGLIWHQVGEHYRMRFINEALRIYFVEEGPSLTQASRRNPAEHAYGQRLYYTRVLNSHINYLSVAPLDLFKAAVQYARASLHLGISLRDQFRALRAPAARALWLFALPVGAAAWRNDLLLRR